MTNIILVNQNDQQIGEIEKLTAHLYDGKLHRAISVILQNNKGEILMTKRALIKPLWPTFWANSFCSHPNVGENLEETCQRRCYEELGIKVNDFQELFSFEYRACWNEFFSENEIDHVFLAKYNGKLKPNPDEVLDYKWLSWKEIFNWVKKEPKIMAPWWIKMVEKIKKDKLD